MRYGRLPFGNLVLALIYLAALTVWAALVADTVDLAQQAAAPPSFPTPTVAPPPQTPSPAPERPAPRPSAPNSPVLQSVSVEPPSTGGHHPKTGRYIAA